MNFNVPIMTKADLTKVIYERHGGLSNKEASYLIDLILEFIKQGLLDSKRVQLSGFGTFVVRDKLERLGRNPQTGEAMVIPGRKTVIFRPSKKIQADFTEEDIR